MIKVKNKKTGVIKELKSESEASMYLATNEWELVSEEKKKETKILSTPKDEK